ncbi:MAG: hypothetical protein FWG35_04950, partial [Spirochaetaceae bacterium]|nr:hypothetical protein [Spirochaetaceae bacterium]
IIFSSFAGMFSLATGIGGYMVRKVSLPWRLLAIAGGLMLIDPGLVTDLAGITLIAAVTIVQVLGKKRNSIHP